MLNLMKVIRGLTLFESYNLSVRDFERGYEDKELRKALKNLSKAYEEMKEGSK